ncbi:Beta-mannosyltransferase 1 [Exophiala xenobiotica]|nr:Beta-mannosyltransferase 1 [Exophiala xenobiotica]KAK5287226.1 Beta-mannosyltransferase 1 [Exophiala xenobiotica]KAK5475343.1 Beta-mannosyltransferase 1 [Exophiala xenobiotica]
MPLPFFEKISAPAKVQRLSIFALLTILLVILFESSSLSNVQVPKLRNAKAGRARSEYYLQWGPFEPMSIPGFVNTGLPGKRSCDTLKHNSTVGVQRSFFLNDNVRQIALSLDAHPVVDYPDDLMHDPNLSVEDIVDKTWTRMSGSSVWLPDQKVYLSVTRVIFCPSQTWSVPKMSFLRGQLFNEDWEHLDNYNITWGDKKLNFPRVFDIPAQWEPDGELYGPEDPRVILEDGVEGAEPVVTFNMIARRSSWKRAIYVFRPFSNHTTILTIGDQERQETEKNWAPFFVPEEELVQPSLANKLHLPTSTVVRKPSEYIHFIYAFKPLRILKCHLRCGDCEFVYEQVLPENFLNHHNENGGSLRGGTNFVPVPVPPNMGLDEKMNIYAAFPRTNIEGRCGPGSFYRPEFVVLINIGAQFHLAFASESLDFGSSIVELGPEDDRCNKGRILIPMSIAHWDTSHRQDIMTVTFSVDDSTVQVARVQGLLGFILNLPQFKTLFKKDGALKGVQSDVMNMLSSWVGDDVRGCLVEAALNYTEAVHDMKHPKNPIDQLDPSKELLRKIYEDQEKEANGGESNEGDHQDEGDTKDPGEPEDPGIPDLEQGTLDPYVYAAWEEENPQQQDPPDQHGEADSQNLWWNQDGSDEGKNDDEHDPGTSDEHHRRRHMHRPQHHHRRSRR